LAALPPQGIAKGAIVANRRTPANKLDTARKDFFLAMMELAEEWIPNNPHTALVEEVLPKWRDAGSTPAPPLPPINH
jgi:hypothetical protein